MAQALLEVELVGLNDRAAVQLGTGRRGFRWTPTVLKVEQVTVTASTFTALSPPTGAKAYYIDLGEAVGITLKGVTGDTGVKVTPASTPVGIPAFGPLGSSPSIGLASSHASNQTVTVYWL
jgi:hypothetical protein